MRQDRSSARALRQKADQRLHLEWLEARLPLCADGDLDDDLDLSISLVHHDEIGIFPPLDPSVSGAAVVSGQVAASGSLSLASVPVLNSLLGASVSLYLDFDGDFTASWGSFSNITTPAFDQDGDATTFNTAEIASMQAIWQQVAEDYAPFNINVTTVLPASFANGVALRVAIGGDGLWSGGTYGGISYISSFTNSIVNTAFVFTKNLGNGNARYTGEAVSHESGHGFGLQHQSLYSGTTKTQEYYAGPGDGRAPIMGNSYSATRGLWWNGTSSVSSSTIQDDMAVIASATNGFGYRADDFGNTAASATPLTVSGNSVSATGLIGTTADKDFFSFSTGAGQVTLTVTPPAGYGNLDARLELWDSAGTTLLASADSTTGFDGTITTTLAAGSYRLAVASHGGYGDVGQYTISGTVLAPVGGVNAPSNLVAAASGSQVNLSWTDNATNETGYSVQRSTDGITWTQIAQLGANAVSHADATVVLGGTYYYRVQAFNATTSSNFSNQAWATLPPTAPTGLAASAASSTRINLSWGNVSGETGYKIERSVNGVNWTQVGTTGTDVTSFQDTTVSANTTYQYRVRATNAGGDSAFSNLASATTPATPTAPVAPVAPSNLGAVAVNARRVDLSWRDNSGNESGFRIERSSNGGRNWSQIAQVGANTTSFSDTSVSRLKTYVYRVRAFNSVGNSAYSNAVQVSTPSAGSLSRAAAPESSSSHAGDANTVAAALVNHERADGPDSKLLVPHGTNSSQTRGVTNTLLADRPTARADQQLVASAQTPRRESAAARVEVTGSRGTDHARHAHAADRTAAVDAVFAAWGDDDAADGLLAGLWS